jgi:uncharacterized membrane protein YgcG
MNKFVLSFLAFLMLFSVKAQDFEVHNYEVDIFIHPDGYFDVVEDYDIFFKRPKHGIYRTIQTGYDLLTSEGEQTRRKIKIGDIKVPGHKFKTPFKFERELSDFLNIKIGDADRTVIGAQHYEIKYRVTNAFLYEESQIQFYWNIKPDGWNAKFSAIDFTIHLPETVSIREDDFFVYSGSTGTTAPSEEFTITIEGNKITGSSIENFVSNWGDSVTVLAHLPANSIAEFQPFWPPWTQYIWVLIIGLLCSVFYMVWRKYGKDDRVVPATSYYPPEGMDPALAGFLIDDKGDTADLISLLPYWGKQGLIKIQEIPKKNIFVKGDTKITRLKALPDTAKNYEKEIFKGIFGSFIGTTEKSVLVSSLKDKFYTNMASAKNKLKEEAQQYYLPKSRKIKGFTLLFLILLLVIFGIAFLFIWGLLALVALIVCCGVLLILNTYMIKKNPRGNEALSELKGFKKFIAVSEQRKLEMLLKDDPGYFESTMSYALAFGLFASWSRKFEKLNTPPPNWYSSTSNSVFTMNNFTSSFNNAMTATQSTMVSSPSSSSSGGGGSSGGGFGGGGGGSW